MIRVCHLVDEVMGWEHRVGISQLFDRLPSERFDSRLARLDTSEGENPPSGQPPCSRLRRPLRSNWLAALGVRYFVEQEGIDLIHTWGPTAATAACSALGRAVSVARPGRNQRPVVLTLHDPRLSTRHIKLWRALADGGSFAIACGSGIVRRRLIEGGFPAGSAVVIRPGVDFARINEFRKTDLRSELGLRRDQFVVITPEPVSREFGAFDAAWAASLLTHVHGEFRMILPGRSREIRRIERFARGLPTENSLVVAGGHEFERLLCAADALVVAARGDVSTTSIAWAMGAGVPTIGSAVHAVAELISHKVNGLLFKQVAGRSMAVRIAKLIEDRESQRKIKETARGQAYEVFGVRRCVENHVRLYENLMESRAAGDGIEDSSRVA